MALLDNTLFCPACSGPMELWQLQCEDCDKSQFWAMRAETYRQEEACKRLDRFAAFERIKAEQPSLYRFMRLGFVSSLPIPEYDYMQSLQTFTDAFLYPTGSRFICPWATTEASDYDVMLLGDQEFCEFLCNKHDWKFADCFGGNGHSAAEHGQSLRKGRLNLIVHFDEDELEAWAAATVWCAHLRGQFDTRQARVALFNKAVREKWRREPEPSQESPCHHNP